MLPGSSRATIPSLPSSRCDVTGFQPREHEQRGACAPSSPSHTYLPWWTLSSLSPAATYTWSWSQATEGAWALSDRMGGGHRAKQPAPASRRARNNVSQCCPPEVMGSIRAAATSCWHPGRLMALPRMQPSSAAAQDPQGTACSFRHVAATLEREP